MLKGVDILMRWLYQLWRDIVSTDWCTPRTGSGGSNDASSVCETLVVTRLSPDCSPKRSST